MPKTVLRYTEEIKSEGNHANNQQKFVQPTQCRSSYFLNSRVQRTQLFLETVPGNFVNLKAF